MIIPKEIKLKYDFNIPYFQELQKILDDTLINYTKKNLFAYLSRIKSLESLTEKIESGRYHNWDSIDDLVACVIIIPNLSYESEVLSFLKTAFVEVNIKEKGSTRKNYETFRFDSTRFIGKLRYSQDKRIDSINFEVQIRSAFEHAWAVTTHDLTYKSQTIDWKTLRLASQLKSAVEQLDMIALGANDICEYIVKYKWPETDTKTEIGNFIARLFDDHKLPDELRPKDLSRVVENIYSLLPRKYHIDIPNIELTELFSIIENNLQRISSKGFPMSLSLFQIIFGILVKENIIKHDVLTRRPIIKDDVFDVIFPDLIGKSFVEFNI